MYETVEDPYCYPGTDTLINKLDIREPELLAAFEAEMTVARAEEPLPVGQLSATHYRKVHHHLFQDVYSQDLPRKISAESECELWEVVERC